MKDEVRKNEFQIALQKKEGVSKNFYYSYEIYMHTIMDPFLGSVELDYWPIKRIKIPFTFFVYPFWFTSDRRNGLNIRKSLSEW